MTLQLHEEAKMQSTVAHENSETNGAETQIHAAVTNCTNSKQTIMLRCVWAGNAKSGWLWRERFLSLSVFYIHLFAHESFLRKPYVYTQSTVTCDSRMVFYFVRQTKQNIRLFESTSMICFKFVKL